MIGLHSAETCKKPLSHPPLAAFSSLSVCYHRDILPGCLHWALQLSVSLREKIPLGKVQVWDSFPTLSRHKECFRRLGGVGLIPARGGEGDCGVLVPRVPDNNLPYFHKRPQVRMLLLAAFCVAVSAVWGVFRNEDQ